MGALAQAQNQSFASMQRIPGTRTRLWAGNLGRFDLPVRKSRGTGQQRTWSRCEASDNEYKALTDVALAEGPPGILGFGFADEELVKLQRHFEPVDLRVVSGAVACRKGATVSDAVGLLTPESALSGELFTRGELFTCFSRVVIFCGLPGEVIEGLIEVWPMDLCESNLISFAYFAESMAGGDLEATLLKIIKASDANDTSEGGMEVKSKEQLRNMLNSLKQGRRHISRGKGFKKPNGFGR